MVTDDTLSASFTAFVVENERRLRHALTAAYGPERGKEAAAEALAYGWEHWARVTDMENPAGYLYIVGKDRARRMRPRKPTLPPLEPRAAEPWIEPALPGALEQLPERQRQVVALVHGYQWSLGEVADVLGVSKGAVQSYLDRGLRRLRRRLGVDL